MTHIASTGILLPKSVSELIIRAGRRGASRGGDGHIDGAALAPGRTDYRDLGITDDGKARCCCRAERDPCGPGEPPPLDDDVISSGR